MKDIKHLVYNNNVVILNNNNNVVKLKINCRGKTWKKLKLVEFKWCATMALNSRWVVKKIKEEISKQSETNENYKTIFLNQWETSNPVQQGKFTEIKIYLRNNENLK